MISPSVAGAKVRELRNPFSSQRIRRVKGVQLGAQAGPLCPLLYPTCLIGEAQAQHSPTRPSREQHSVDQLSSSTPQTTDISAIIIARSRSEGGSRYLLSQRLRSRIRGS